MQKVPIANDIELCYEGLMTAIHTDNFLDIKEYVGKMQRILEITYQDAEMKKKFKDKK